MLYIHFLYISYIHIDTQGWRSLPPHSHVTLLIQTLCGVDSKCRFHRSLYCEPVFKRRFFKKKVFLTLKRRRLLVAWV